MTSRTSLALPILFVLFAARPARAQIGPGVPPPSGDAPQSSAEAQPPPGPPAPVPPPPAPAPFPGPPQPPPMSSAPAWAPPFFPQPPPPAPPAPPAPTPPAPVGITGAGLPLDQRGVVALDTASFTDAGGNFSAIQLRLVASVPLKSHVLLDARLPLGFATRPRTNAVLGNAMLGAHGVAKVGASAWIVGGGALGLPLLSGRAQDNGGFMSVQVPRAFWDLHEYLPSIVPLEGRFGVEGHLGIVILRGDAGAILSFPIGENDQVEFAFQHAVEVQVGHALGAGLRLQGVALPTFHDVYKNSYAEGDLYQLAMEPFLALEQRLVSMRAGIMLPLDRVLGPPFAGSYGFRLGVGVRLE